MLLLICKINVPKFCIKAIVSFYLWSSIPVFSRFVATSVISCSSLILSNSSTFSFFVLHIHFKTVTTFSHVSLDQKKKKHLQKQENLIRNGKHSLCRRGLFLLQHTSIAVLRQSNHTNFLSYPYSHNMKTMLPPIFILFIY